MLSLPQQSYEAILAHAEQSGTNEVCGILGGEFDGEHSIVESVHRTTNAADRPAVRYAIDPEEQFEHMTQIRAAGAAVVGFYHSHPTGPPRPSETDRTRATWPDRSYVIVTTDGQPSVCSWRFDRSDGAFEPEAIEILDAE